LIYSELSLGSCCCALFVISLVYSILYLLMFSYLILLLLLFW